MNTAPGFIPQKKGQVKYKDFIEILSTDLYGR